MALKAVLDNLDSVDEAFHGEYIEKDGKFYLDIDGIETHPKATAVKNALDRVRQEKKDLQTQLTEAQQKLEGLPEDFTQEEWERLQALDVDVDPSDDDETKKRKRKEKADERLGQLRQQMQQQIDTLKRSLESKDVEIEELRDSKDGIIGDLVRDRSLSEAMDGANIDPKFRTAVRSLHRSNIKFEIEDGNTVRTYVETDLGESTVSEYLENWSKSEDGKIFVTDVAGPDAKGGGGRRVAPGENPFSAEGWNKTRQAQLRTDPKAERLATAAGFKDLSAALKATKPLATS